MFCLLPIKIISISSPAVFCSLVQTSTPIQFSTLREPGLIHREKSSNSHAAETNSMHRSRVINAEVHGLFVLDSKSSCHFLSLFPLGPAQFLSVSVILKMFSEAIGLNFLQASHMHKRKTLLFVSVIHYACRCKICDFAKKS